MLALCVGSPMGQAGKTAVCAVLAKRFQNDGKRVGFLKPVSVIPDSGEAPADADCLFMKQVLELSESAGLMCPVSLAAGRISSPAATNGNDITRRVQEAYREISKNKDVVLIEGPAGLGKGSLGAALLTDILGGAIQARLLVVVKYQGKMVSDDLVGMDPNLRTRVIGVVVNSVPTSRMGAKNEIIAGLGLPVFGFLPQERALLGVTVAELAEALSGKIIPPGDGAGELVENVMAGAATLDHGPVYFGRKLNKAVVVRGERPDMQLAALETPTKVLVLTGGVKPIDAVLRQARQRKVPLMIVDRDSQATLSGIETALSRASFVHEQKLRRLDEIFTQHFDYKGLVKALGA